MASIFKRALPKKRLNPKGNSELRSAQGGINYDASELLAQSFSESDTSYKMGSNGLRDNPHKTEHRAVAGDFANFAEDTIVDSAEQGLIRVTPEMRNLVNMFAEHLEPAGSDFSFTEGQMRAFRKFFNDKKRINAANELARLRQQKAPVSIKDRQKKMELEAKMAAMRTELTRIARSA